MSEISTLMDHMQKPRTDVRQLKEDMNMDSKPKTRMNEIRALSADELNAVSGGAHKEMFNFTVAGMKISGGYDDKTGGYSTLVEYGSSAIWQGKF